MVHSGITIIMATLAEDVAIRTVRLSLCHGSVFWYRFSHLPDFSFISSVSGMYDSALCLSDTM